MSPQNPSERLRNLRNQISVVKNDYGAAIDKSESSLRSSIFEGDDLGLIEQYGSLFENLSALYDNTETRSSLVSRLQEINDSLLSGPVSSQVSEELVIDADEMIPYREAVSLWKEYDKDNENKVRSNDGYRFRIRNGNKRDQLRVTESNGNITSVSKSDLYSLMETFQLKNYSKIQRDSLDDLDGRVDAQDNVDDEGDVWLSLSDARDKMREYDEEHGTPINDLSYTVRIRKASKKGQLETRKTGNNITGVKESSLDEFISNYRANPRLAKVDQKGPRANVDDSSTNVPDSSGGNPVSELRVLSDDELKDYITPRTASDFYRDTENKVSEIDNSNTSDRAYNERIRAMMVNGLVTKAKGPDGILINKKEFVTVMSGKIKASIKDRRSNKSKKQSENSVYPEYKQLRLSGNSSEEAREKMNLTSSKVRITEAIFARHERDYYLNEKQRGSGE